MMSAFENLLLSKLENDANLTIDGVDANSSLPSLISSNFLILFARKVGALFL